MKINKCPRYPSHPSWRPPRTQQHPSPFQALCRKPSGRSGGGPAQGPSRCRSSSAVTGEASGPTELKIQSKTAAAALLVTYLHPPDWMFGVLPGWDCCRPRKTGLARLAALPHTCGVLKLGKTKPEQEHPGYFKFQGMFSFPKLAYFKPHFMQSPVWAPPSSPGSTQGPRCRAARLWLGRSRAPRGWRLRGLLNAFSHAAIGSTSPRENGIYQPAQTELRASNFP